MHVVQTRLVTEKALTACCNAWTPFGCAFYLQTQSMDTDDYDDKITQNTDAQSGVSITNLSK